MNFKINNPLSDLQQQINSKQTEPVWIDLNLNSPWTPAFNSVPQYSINGKIVSLRGFVSGTGAGELATNLPIQYPSFHTDPRDYPMVGGSGFNFYAVRNISGENRAALTFGGTLETFVNLNQIRYITE